MRHKALDARILRIFGALLAGFIVGCNGKASKIEDSEAVPRVVAVKGNTGGFIAIVHSSTYANLHWDAVPDIEFYYVFRGKKPEVSLDGTTLVTWDLTGTYSNNYLDNGLIEKTKFYYVIAAEKNGKVIVVATGSCITPSEPR